jgi:hypothetical protein
MLTRGHLPLLRGARELIDTGDSQYICPALSCAGNQLGVGWYVVAQACDFIQAGIDGEYTLDNWLYDRGFRPQGRADYNRLARLAWLDKLIHDLENP